MNPAMNQANQAMSPAARLLALPVRAYRLLLSPWLGSQCRFTPTCSAYALQALEHHGAWRGVAKAGWRILRCHPWCAGGHDPVLPEATSSPNPTVNANRP